jgi:hypothetical protein
MAFLGAKRAILESVHREVREEFFKLLPGREQPLPSAGYSHRRYDYQASWGPHFLGTKLFGPRIDSKREAFKRRFT